MAADRIELILDRAMDFATERSHEYVTLEHLLLSVLQEPPVHKIIEQLKINIDDITVHRPENSDGTILFEDAGGVGIKMKYPTADIIGKINPEKFESVEGVMDLIVDCIDSIFDEDNVYDSKNEKRADLVEFIESLSSEQFKSVQAFFQDTPSVSYDTVITCDKCKVDNEIELRGLNSFFS